MGKEAGSQSIGQVCVEDVLRFQHKRIATNLFKNFLVVLEDLQRRHEDAIYKLRETLPAQYKDYAHLIDYWSDAEMESMRKKILDAGNDTIRQLDEQLANYDIAIKSSKGTLL